MRQFIAFYVLLVCHVCAADDIRGQFRGLADLRTRSDVTPAPAPPADGAGVYLPLDQYPSPGVIKLWAPWCDACKTENVSDWLEASGWPVTPVNVGGARDGEIDPAAEKVFGEIPGLPHFVVVRNKQAIASYTGNDAPGFTPVLKHAVLVVTGASHQTDGDATPTPHPVVIEMLKGLNLKPGDRYGDFGSGDGRTVIAAAQQHGVVAVGVEIDAKRAADAKRRVEALGLADLVTITHGDATKTDLGANKGFAYLYPGTLVDLRPQIDKMERFATYRHPLPWRSDGQKQGDLYFYGPAQAQAPSKPATHQQYREVPYAIYQGWKYYSAPCSGWGCGMCQEINRQIAAREHIEMQPVVAQQSTGYCRNCRGDD